MSMHVHIRTVQARRVHLPLSPLHLAQIVKYRQTILFYATASHTSPRRGAALSYYIAWSMAWFDSQFACAKVRPDAISGLMTGVNYTNGLFTLAATSNDVRRAAFTDLAPIRLFSPSSNYLYNCTSCSNRVAKMRSKCNRKSIIKID